MSMQDPISDLLTCIRNAQMVGKESITIGHSKQKESILKVLEAEGYIAGFQASGEQKPSIKILLKYFQGKPVIEKIHRVSRPSLRKYESCQTLPKVLGGLGVAIVSTSQGVMSDKQARQAGLGGEILCTVE